MKQLRRTVALAIVLVMLAATTLGCSSTASQQPKTSMEDLLKMDWAEIEKLAKEEGEVVFMTWYNEEFYTSLLQAFSEKYGIKGTVVNSDRKALSQKVLAEKDGATGTIDVSLMSSEFIKSFMDSNVLAGPILDKMEAKDLLDVGLGIYQEGVPVKGYAVPFYLNQTGLLYNSKTVKEEDLPQTWEEIGAWIKANPMRFGMNTPDTGGSGQSFVHLAIGELTGGYDQYQGDLECDEAKVAKWSSVWDWFNEYKEYMTFTSSNNDSISRLNQGEFDIVPAWDDDSFVAMAAGELTKDAKLYIPKCGAAGGGDTLGVIANAKNKAAALLLVNWLTSQEAQELLSEAYMPARSDVPPKASVIAENGFYGERVAWIPAVYKVRFNQDFTKFVLMQ